MPVTIATNNRVVPDHEIESLAAKATVVYHPGRGLDQDDLTQSARIGIWKAARLWNPGRGSAWGTFAVHCARMEIITAFKTATSVKRLALVDAAPFDSKPPGREDGLCLGDLLCRENDDPARVVIALDEARRLLQRISRLTPLEREAVRRVLILGEHYAACGDLGSLKRVDNAVQRARRKLRCEDTPDARPAHRTFYIDRTVHPTRATAERAARDLCPTAKVVGLVPRKLIDGRERAPQGRSTTDGRRGIPVWRVDVDADALAQAA